MRENIRIVSSQELKDKLNSIQIFLSSNSLQISYSNEGTITTDARKSLESHSHKNYKINWIQSVLTVYRYRTRWLRQLKRSLNSEHENIPPNIA